MDISHFKKDHNGIIVNKRQVRTMVFTICYFVCVCILLLFVSGWTTRFEPEITKQHLRLSVYGSVAILALIEISNVLSFRKITAIFEGNLKDLTHAFSLLGLKLECNAERTKNSYKFRRELLILPKGQFSVNDHGDFCEITGSKTGIKYLSELIDLKLK